MAKMWNLWHGCKKFSAGCANCYVYRSDARYERDASKVVKTQAFDLPVRKNRYGQYVHKSGTMFWTCFTSDFLLDECDTWREEAWNMIKERSDCRFFFITKRIERFASCMPVGWGSGWQNVTVCATCENQDTAERRLPVLTALPIKHKCIALEPLLGAVDISPWLGPHIEQVVAGGESGFQARPCRYEWILSIRGQCAAAGVTFTFKQTGYNFYKDGKQYAIPRHLQHSQAKKAGINLIGRSKKYI